MSYAIISLGGKQYRVREGERLLVDRMSEDEGATVTPRVLLVGGDGEPDLDPRDGVVTARVVGHVLGEKVRIGKYKPKTGYRRHAGFRARLSQIEIEAIGTEKREPRKRTSKAKAEAAREADSAAPRAESEDKPRRRRTKKAEEE